MRHFIRVLRLLETCSLDELTAAVEPGVGDRGDHGRQRPGAPGGDRGDGRSPLFRLDGRPHLAGVPSPGPT